MNDFKLRLSHISKSYGTNRVLDDISLEINPGEFIVVTGPSGSGKSTFLNVIGLTDDFEGSYFINERKIKRSQYPKIRNKHIGFVFQLYYLLPGMNVKDNILTPLIYASRKDFKNNHKERFKNLVQRLGIEHLLDKKSDVLSGGEKQRVCIARALMMEPDILLADEPTGALDENNSDEVIDIFRNYVNDGHSIIMVTHNKAHKCVATKTFVLENGGLNDA